MLPENLSDEALFRFVGGRRRYNTRRQIAAMERRHKLLFFWAKHPALTRADLARYFGVSRATVTRDVQWLKVQQVGRRRRCPLCEGTGKLDLGPGLVSQIETLGEVYRNFPHLL